MMGFTLFDMVSAMLFAARWTLALSAIALLGGAALGVVLMVLRIAENRLARQLAGTFISLVQGTPLLIQLFLMFFGVAAIGYDVSAAGAAGLTLVVWTGAFLGDIWRGCVQSIARGQWEASAALGMGWLQQIRQVVFPQAFRIAIPATVGFSVQVIKATALTSVIGFIELTRTANFIANATYKPLLTYFIAATIYFFLCWPLSLWAARLARSGNVARRTA